MPQAQALKPDLVTVGAGVNDALRRSFSLDTLCTDLENSVRELTAGGSHVLLFAYGDPSRGSKAFGRVADRMRSLRSATLDIAAAYGCTVVDFWGIALYDDTRLWSADRLHLSSMGHRLTAEAVMDALGLGSDAVAIAGVRSTAPWMEPAPRVLMQRGSWLTQDPGSPDGSEA